MCAQVSLSNRRTTSTLRAESLSTSRTVPAEIDGPCRSLLHTSGAFPAALAYHILHPCSPPTDSPFFQPNPFATPPISQRAPCPRHRPPAPGSVSPTTP